MNTPFDFEDAVLPVPEPVSAAFNREWERLARPGPTLTGEQRISAAGEARTAALQGIEAMSEDAPPAARAAQQISVAAHHIDGAFVEWLEQDGLARLSYLEITCIVSRLSAVDTYCRGIGITPGSLPEAIPGDPDGGIDDKAQLGRAWVPIVGPAGALTAMSALPAENAARDDIHVPLYMPVEDMPNFAYQGVLSRAQMELLAARTSFLNDCRY